MFLATAFQGSLLDFIAVALLIFFSLIGLRQGFVNRIVGVVAGFVALIVAISFCKPFANLLNLVFNIQGSLGNSLTKSFAKNDSLNVLVTDIEQVKNVLANQNILPGFIKNAVLKVVDFSQEQTIAQLLGQICSKFAVIGISFIILLVVVRLACTLLKFVFSKIEDKHVSIFLANKVLGVCFGFAQCLIIICATLFIASLLPSSIMGWFQRTVEQSKICAFLTDKNLLAPLFALLLGF